MSMLWKNTYQKWITMIVTVFLLLTATSAHAEVADKVSYPWEGWWISSTILICVGLFYVVFINKSLTILKRLLIILLLCTGWISFRLLTDDWFDSQIGHYLRKELVGTPLGNKYTRWMYLEALLPVLFLPLLGLKLLIQPKTSTRV